MKTLMLQTYIFSSVAPEPRLGSDLGSARAIFQKARIEKNWQNEPRISCYALQPSYSGGHLRFYGKNVSFCPSPTNDIPKTNKVPFKSPIKMLPEMQKKLNFSKFVIFGGPFFENCVVLENWQI